MDIWSFLDAVTEYVDIADVILRVYPYLFHLGIFVAFCMYMSKRHDIDIFESARQFIRRLAGKKRQQK